MFDSFFNPIFFPIFNLKPIVSITIISFILTLLITLIYKWTTDQKLMKSLKDDLKKGQDEMKKYRQDPKKMMEVQKKAMEKNFEYMKHSFKATLWTMIPILLIFGYLNTHLGYYPIIPGQEFTTNVVFKDGTTGTVEIFADNLEVIGNKTQTIQNNAAVFKLKGNEGEYVLDYKYKDTDYQQDLLITNEPTYKPLIKLIKSSDIKELHINNEKVIALNLFGWKLGWLGTYILLSIVFSMILRKIMNIY